MINRKFQGLEIFFFEGIRLKNEGNSLPKLQYKEMSFSCASIIWIRFQGTFSGDFFFSKPPPLTKLFQFIAIGENVKQNKDYNMQSLYFFCFLRIHTFSEKETVQSLNASKSDVNNLYTIKLGLISKEGDFAELCLYKPFICLLHIIADNYFAPGKECAFSKKSKPLSLPIQICIAG